MSLLLSRSLYWFGTLLLIGSSLFAQARWTRWEQLHARVDHAMVYDPNGQRVLMIGGTRWESVYGAFDTIWQNQGGQWSPLASTPPLPRPSAVWDITRNELFTVAVQHSPSLQHAIEALPWEISLAEA